MKLEILYKDKRMEEFQIVIAWQDHNWGMDRLYYETQYDKPGKGKFIDTNNILTWRVTPTYK